MLLTDLLLLQTIEENKSAKKTGDHSPVIDLMGIDAPSPFTVAPAFVVSTPPQPIRTTAPPPAILSFEHQPISGAQMLQNARNLDALQEYLTRGKAFLSLVCSLEPRAAEALAHMKAYKAGPAYEEAFAAFKETHTGQIFLVADLGMKIIGF